MVSELIGRANNILLLSIRPEYVSKLLDGSKSSELRRVRPRVVRDDIVLIYETSPTMALVGYGIVDNVIEDRPHVLWEKVEETSGINSKEFVNYYKGADIGYAINLSTVSFLQNPVSLSQLRKKIDGFHPPQSYRYLCCEQASYICQT